LVVDRDGLSVNSAVSKANIRWKDLLYVEEVFVEDGEGNGAHYMILISATDSFELTTTWDQFSEIRRCVLANAPEGAIVVL